MIQKNIAIIGNASSDFVDFASETNTNYTIFLDTRREKNVPHVIPVDFSDYEGLVTAIEEHAGVPFTAILTFYEEYIVTTSLLAKRLGLKSLSPESALACTDKTVMRGAFLGASTQISPAFKIIETLDDALEFAHTHGYPLIIKPASLAKSLLVTKIHSESELHEQYFKIMDLLPAVYQKYAPRNEPKLLIEEFMEGTIHSIDAFVDDSGEPMLLQHCVDYQTGYDIGYDDNFHFSRLLPSNLSAHDQKALHECAAAGVRCLGMSYSPAHIEIIMTKNGPRIVEIGARNGGYRQKMHQSAHGINLYKNHIALLHGEPLDIQPKKNDSCAVMELFPKQPGIFSGVHNLEALEELASLRYLNVRSVLGDQIGKSGDGFKAAAVVMLHNASHAAFQKDMAWFIENVYIKTTAA